MRFVSYVRFTSSLKDVIPARNEIEVQTHRIKEYADARGWKIMKKYSDRKHDPDEDRGFEQLRTDGIRGCFDVVIVDSIFHAGRSFLQGRDVFLSFLYAGIGFVVTEDDFQSMGKSMEEINRYFVSKRTYGNTVSVMSQREKLHQEGKIMSSEVPFGYRLDADNRVVPDPRTASTVQRIFSLADEGKTPTDIASALHREPMPDLYKWCDGQMHERERLLWERRQVLRILKNPAYTGCWKKKCRRQELVMTSEPVVSAELFARVQSKIKDAYDGPLTPRHVLVYFMEDSANPQRPIRYCEVEGEAYLELIRGKWHMKDNLRLSVAEAEAAVENRLAEEQQKAQQVLERIRQEGVPVKAALIEEQMQRFRTLADRIVDSERRKMQAYRQYQTGEMLHPEWESIQREAQTLVRELEESFFAGHQEKLNRIEKAISPENPWIATYRDIQLKKPWNKKDLGKLVSKIVLNDMRIESIELTQQDWYNELPKAWRITENGTEK